MQCHSHPPPAHPPWVVFALLQSFVSGRRTLMDSFDYVMHGKVFKFNDNSASGQLKADVSAVVVCTLLARPSCAVSCLARHTQATHTNCLQHHT